MNKNDKWIIDSGCSHHMTGDTSKFSTFETYDENNVKFGNDAPCHMKGKGYVVLTNKIICDNTKFLEGLNYNLLSVAQLNRSGCKVEFIQRMALIYNIESNLIRSEEKTKGNLLYLNEAS